MSAAPRLDERERARLLGLIGVDRYQRRGTTPMAPTEPVVASPPRAQPASAMPATRSRSAPVHSAPSTTRALRPSLLEDPALAARAPRLLLLVETPRTPDPRSRALLAAIRRMLPPHHMLDASDTPSQWPAFALTLGASATPAAGTRHIRAPALSELIGDAHAKRELWRVLKPLLRAARGN